MNPLETQDNQDKMGWVDLQEDFNRMQDGQNAKVPSQSQPKSKAKPQPKSQPKPTPFTMKDRQGGSQGEKSIVHRVKGAMEMVRGSAVLLGLSIGATVALLNAVNFFQPLEWQGYRLLFSARDVLSSGQFPFLSSLFPPSAWDDRLALIAIDDRSLNTYGQFATWKRDHYTELLNLLQASPPAALGFAMLFPEDTPEDQAFAEAMLFNGTIVLGVARDSQGNTLLPRPFLSSIAGLGHVQSVSDPDGITRSTWLYLPNSESNLESNLESTSESVIPSLGVALAQVYNETLRLFGSQDPTIAIPDPQSSLQGNQVWINWPAPARKLPQYSLAGVLNHEVDPSHFANKIVLVGITATGLESNPLRTPFYNDAKGSGVYLYAATLDNLLNDRFLHRPQPLWVGVGLVLLGAISAFGFQRVSLQWQLLAFGVFPGVWFSGAILGFYTYWWLPITAPILTLWLTGIALQLRSYNDRQLLMDLFSKHVSTETAQLIWERRSEIFESGELQAQELTATVLFMDIRGFTTISERFQPADLLRWLNRYLDAMTDCIMSHGGVVDKYIGDAIMAVFGIPIPRASVVEIRQDAINAIAAGIAMHQRLQDLNQELQSEGLPTIRFGIGIHTGTVVAGSVGGSQRLNYSVVGDAVNTAARIEALNKNIQSHNPYDLLISGHTFAYVREHYVAKPLQSLTLRGKAVSTVIYAIQEENQGYVLPKNPLHLLDDYYQLKTEDSNDPQVSKVPPVPKVLSNSNLNAFQTLLGKFSQIKLSPISLNAINLNPVKFRPAKLNKFKPPKD